MNDSFYDEKYNDNGWYIELNCRGNGPFENEPCGGCNETFVFCYEDINYRESECGNIYSFICPSCFRETIIQEVDLPEHIRELIKDNNGYDSKIIRSYKKY